MAFTTFRRPTYHCYDCMLAAVADYYGLDIALYFSDAMHFQYRRDDFLQRGFDSHAIWYGPPHRRDLLADFCGLKLQTHTQAPFTTSIDRELAAGRPVGIKLDSWHLPWNQLHHQVHRTHYVLLIEQCADGYVCSDTFITPDMQVFPNALLQHAEVLYTFQPQPAPFDPDEYAQFMKTCYAQTESASLIESFASDLRQVPIKTLPDAAGMERSELLFCLASVVWSRHNFPQALFKAAEAAPSVYYNALAEQAMACYELWGKMRQYLFLAGLRRNASHLEKCADLLGELGNKEDELLSLFRRVDP